jgi:hypothetical protein
MFRTYTGAMQKTLAAVPAFLIALAGLALAACGSTSTGTSSHPRAIRNLESFAWTLVG